jgi:hypothetical protein
MSSDGHRQPQQIPLYRGLYARNIGPYIGPYMGPYMGDGFLTREAGSPVIPHIVPI